MRNADKEILISEIELFLKEGKADDEVEEDAHEDYEMIIRQIGYTLLKSTKENTLSLMLKIQNKCFEYIEENFEAGDNIEENPALRLAVDVGELTVQFFENA